MHLLCPHCHNPIEVVKLPTREEIICPSCGSSFRLEGSSTTTWTPRKLGKFEIVHTVGTGAFGTVYQAHDPELDRVVAIKVPRAGNLADSQDLDRFLREARSVAQLRHPGIVPVYEVGQADSVPYLVAEFVQGVTLADQLTARQPPPREAAQLIAAVADSLQYAHEHGVVHRDVKPSNIMLGDDGTPHLMDFGLAKREAGEITMTMEGEVLGTPAYMSPEQARGESHLVDGRSDVYSLGVILYRMLTGELPFRGNTRMLLHQVLQDEPRPPRSLNDHIPRDLETICLKAMAKEPGRRYATARELADDLRRYLRGDAIQARPIGAWERLLLWVKRRPAAAALLLVSVVAAMALAGLVVGLLYNNRLKDALAKAEQAQLAESEQRQKAEAASHDLQEAREREKREAQRAWCNLALDRGLALCEQGDAGSGMLWLARSLELAPAGADDLQRVIRTNLAAWHYKRHPLNALLPHESGVYAVTFSPNGKTILTGSADKKARLWDAATGKLLLPPLDHPQPVRAVAFSPDARWVVTGSEDGMARLWEAATGKLLPPTMQHQRAVQAVAFSPDGRLVATASEDGTARLWDVTRGKSTVPPLAHARGIWAVAFSPDGKLLLTGSADGTARLWSVKTGQASGEPLPHYSNVLTVAFSPDGRTFLTGKQAFDAQLWEVASRRDRGTPLHHESWIFSAAFSPDGQTVLTGSRDGTARLWEVATGKPIGPPLKHPTAVRSVAFSPDGRTILTGSEDGMARLWEASPTKLFDSLFQHPYLIQGVAFSSDGKLILEGGGGFVGTGTAQVWDVATGKPHGEPVHHPLTVTGVAFNPDGRIFLTSSGDQTVRLWSSVTQKPLGPPLQHQYPVHRAVFSHDGKLVLTGSGDFEKGEARLWEAATGKPLSPPLLHRQRVLAVAFSPDDRIILTASEDQTARLWKAATGKPLALLQHQNAVWAAAFSPDGQTVLTGDWNKTAQLWETKTGKPFGPRFQHAGPVMAGAFSPDGRTILTGSFDGSARLWDAATGKALGPPLAHQGEVHAVAFSPDGRTILTGSYDATARLWQAPAPLPGEVERLMLWCRVTTNMELDDVVRVLDGPTWLRYQQSLKELGGPPDGFARSTDQVAGWHRGEAEDCERRRQWFAALWHLNRLIEAEPGDPVSWYSKALELDPKNAQAWHRRAHWHVGLQHWDQGAADFAKALSLVPDSKDPWFTDRAGIDDELVQWDEVFNRVANLRPKDAQLWIARVRYYGRRAQWQEAATAIAKVVELDPSDHRGWFYNAPLCLQLGDVEGYRRVCREMLDRFGQTDKPEIARRTAKTCSLAPNAVSNFERVMKLADQGFPGNDKGDSYHWFLLGKGMADYRAGQFASAIERFRKSLTGSEHYIDAMTYLFRAMAQQRLGQSDAARSSLALAREIMEHKFPNIDEGELLDIQWPDWLMCHIVRREAEKLLGVDVPSPAKEKEQPQAKAPSRQSLK